MGVRGTSRESYHDHRNSGKLTAQQQLILERLRASCRRYGPHDFSLQEIAANTNLAINVVSGRVNELKNEPLNMLVECPPRKCKVTGKTIKPVILAEYAEAGRVAA